MRALNVIEVDAGAGEGGGQVFRTALALAAVTGTSVRLRGIRARRQPPGLKPQHVTAAEALAQIVDGTLQGAVLGSQDVLFTPGAIRPGRYRFDIGTAGATTLVLHCLLWPLACAEGPSELTLTGGTHVPWSPPVHYLDAVLFPALRRMGIEAHVALRRWGFFPRGGGEIVVTIEPRRPWRAIHLVRGTRPESIRGISTVAGLPRSIAERQRDRALAALAAAGWSGDIALEEGVAASPGSCLFLACHAEDAWGGATALGERGRPAEAVADAAVTELLAFLVAEAGCDPYLADQLILPMALATGTSRLTTSRITGHLMSAIELIRHFLGCPVKIGGTVGEPGSVTLEGIGGTVIGEARMAGDLQPEAHGVQRGGGATTTEAGARIRKPRATDGPAIQRLLGQFARKGELLPRTLNEVYRNLRDFVVAESGGEVIGVCGLSVYWEDLSEIRSLAVDEAHGGKGLGTALVQACLDEAAALGIKRVFALTYRPGFFARLGFRELDKRELPEKIWKDCIQCAKFHCCDETALIRDVHLR